MIKTKIDAVYFELVWHMIFKCGNSIVPKNDHFYPKLKEAEILLSFELLISTL